jgi:hypothetical protein
MARVALRWEQRTLSRSVRRSCRRSVVVVEVQIPTTSDLAMANSKARDKLMAIARLHLRPHRSDHRPLHGADAHRSVQPFHAGLRRGLSGSAWRWRTPTGSQRWWSRTRWLTRTAWGHFGKPAVLSGLTAPATKPLSGRTRPSMPPVTGTWGLAPTCPCTTRTSGPTSSRS